MKKFFEENQDKYDAYHLFPVRYQILSNENILEFLKYDVVLNLLQKNPDIFKNENKSGVKIYRQIISKVLKEKKNEI